MSVKCVPAHSFTLGAIALPETYTVGLCLLLILGVNREVAVIPLTLGWRPLQACDLLER